MEYLPNGYTLELAPDTFPLSTDSMALAHFVRLPRNARVLDLGSGCGTLGLLLCSQDAGCQVTGVELDPAAHEAALENIRRNQLQSRMHSICGDLRRVSECFAPGSFSCCVSNPPYFSGGPASRTIPAARREDCCTPGELFRSAAWALKYGGDFFLVHRPFRLAEIMVTLSALRLEPKRMRLVYPFADREPNMVLLEARRGAKSRLSVEKPLIVFRSPGVYTDEITDIYGY